MKQKGFTSLELLIVLVIVSTVLVIAVPLVLEVIENSEKSHFESSAYGIVESIEYYYAHSLLNGKTISGDKSFSFPNQELTYKGSQPLSGKALLTYDGKVDVALYDGTWCAKKNTDTDKVELLKLDASECRLSVESQSRMQSLERVQSASTPFYYKGANPANYVLFNHELWRMISIVDGKIKLVKNHPIASFDTENNTISDIIMQYYNGLPDVYKKMIEKMNVSNRSLSFDQSSTYDRLMEATSQSFTQADISLITITDYIYASNDINCLSNPLKNSCENQNWLSSLKGNVLFQNVFDFSNTLWYGNKGKFYTTEDLKEDNGIMSSYLLYPVITLNETVFFEDGNGSYDKPYVVHVSSENSLRDCTMYGNQCVFQGQNPANYVIFNSQIWRILSIEGNYARLIAPESFSYEWSSKSNDWETASLREYLNTSWYDTLLEESKQKLVSYPFKTGLLPGNNYDLLLLKQYEASRTWTGKIGLINLSDYILASNHMLSTDFPYGLATTENWLGNEFLWTLNGLDNEISYSNVYITSFGNETIGVSSVNQKQRVRPVVVVDISKGFSKGNGTILKPYYLFN